MSFRTVQQNTLENSDTLSVPPFAAAVVSQTYVRNPSWPALPSIIASDNKLVALYAVFPGGSFAAVNVTTSTGNYTVDWGDGSVTNHSSTVQANYTYDYSNANLTGTNAPVTFTDATDVVNRANHGYTDGMPISFASITTTTGITAGVTYYVINSTTNTFQLAASVGGSVLPLTNDGSGVILSYKIAVVTITPQNVGATLTQIDLNKRNVNTSVVYGAGWLDIAVAGSLTDLWIGATGGSIQITYPMLEQVRILRHRDTNLSDLFANCYNLQNVVEITADTGINVTSTAQTFINCNNLVNAPFFNTGTVTTMLGMFNGCRNLKTVPLYNTAAVTNMQDMFLNCSALTTVPPFNTVSVTNMTTMFSTCRSLVNVPLLNTASVGTMFGMFFQCGSLITVPLFNTASCTNMVQMFDSCSSLVTVPLFNTAAVTNTSLMFNACRALVSVPLFNMVSVTDANQMFVNCSSLTTLPLFNTANVTNMRGFCSGCSSLVSVPLFNTASVTNFFEAFKDCSSLRAIPQFNLTSVAASYPTAAFVSANASFQNNISMTSVGITALGNNSTGRELFSACRSLVTVPLMNTSTLADATNFFNGCTSLQTLPALDFGALVTSTGAFTSCPSLGKVEIQNISITVSFASCKLSATSLDEIYTNLRTVIPAGQSVTFQGGGVNTVTLSNHGYSNGRVISFATITTTTGISTNTQYYVRNATTNTFQLSAVSQNPATGTILTLTNNGSGTVNGQTITVTGNYGVAGDNPTIATAKGWTVTGS